MIGWYVHHHGFGHVTRMRAVQPYLTEPVTVFSSLAAPEGLPPDITWVRLDGDADPIPTPDGGEVDPAQLDPTARGALHWAPLGHPGHRARLATIAQWIAGNDVSTFVVDVSAEVTAFVRLLGVRTVVMAQPGDRTDAPHRLAYDLADRIVAPWAEGVIDAAALRDRGDRVAYVGGISRFDGRVSGARSEDPARGANRALFLGRTVDVTRLEATVAALHARGWLTDLAGARDDGDRVDDVWSALRRSTVVVSAAGQNSIADLAAAGVAAVVIAQDRPFDEQRHTARVIAARGLALTAPDTVSSDDLADLIERAATCVSGAPDWTSWRVTGAAQRAARAIEEAS
ncbi:glycosyltransferase [Microbacterium aurantiacum]|uniref:glycosyltransferase n=1 Tax=Microbacterium aurantiacum TaxID=162393 RepID=UPI0034128E52